ncbi:MAG: dimethylsulfoniopropionate demethylase [Parasphingorhabdus sp.]
MSGVEFFLFFKANQKILGVAFMADGLNLSRRLRRSPYTQRVEAAGVRGFSVVNHMLLPKAYHHSVEDDYWHLREHVQIWDVSCQRQVQIEGPDAARLVQWMTPRDISKARIGQCLYVPIVDSDGGLINDPVLLKLGENCFWLSIADSDLLLFAKGLAIGAKLNVQVTEPDVSPLSVQGPKAEQLLVDLFGQGIKDVGFFRFDWFDFKGTAQLIARSGYSRQGGFEIYLANGQLGPDLWDAVSDAGQKYNIRPGCPNLIERIEGGLFSYGNEMTRANNPFEIGLGKYCTLDGSIDCVGLIALQQIEKSSIKREVRGVKFGEEPCGTCAEPWPLSVAGVDVGAVTSAAWSPRLKCNVGLSLVDQAYWEPGQSVEVTSSSGSTMSGLISDLPIE